MRPGAAVRGGSLALLVALCTALAPAGGAAADPRAAPGGSPDATSVERDSLDRLVLDRIAVRHGLGGTVAVAVAPLQHPGLHDRGLPPGGVHVTGSAAADRAFPTASLVKLFLAEDVLHRAREGSLTLAPSDYALLQAMSSDSDDAAASRVWVRFGGGQMIRDVAARYGLTGTAPPADPSQWGETVTTAADLARFLAALPVIAAPPDAGALLAWLRMAAPVAADGFDQRFGLLAAPLEASAVKQGWMCCLAGNRHLHSAGVVGDRAVVLLSEVPATRGWAATRAALTAAAGALTTTPGTAP
jgi:hypothetical protein